jgi:hypothetical protein
MVTLPKGTLVHFNGFPFRLEADVETNGSDEGYKFALDNGMESNRTGPGQVTEQS